MPKYRNSYQDPALDREIDELYRRIGHINNLGMPSHSEVRTYVTSPRVASGVAAGTYVAPTLTVDVYGGITNAVSAVPVTTQTADYTLVLGDAGTTILMNKASAVNLTIPANASVVFDIGTKIDVVQYGAGQVTVGITTDTLRIPNGGKTRGQYAVITLHKIAAAEWVVSGDSVV